jgi:hypothetical protein
VLLVITHVKEEHESSKPGKKYIGEVEPDFNQAISPTIAEFIFKASDALREFRDRWLETHPDDNFARGLEIDIAPVHTDGSVMGFMALSEIDGKSYDYVPAKSQDNLREVDK